jgi:predicted RNA-binding Zn ribbon-like protein
MITLPVICAWQITSYCPLAVIKLAIITPKVLTPVIRTRQWIAGGDGDELLRSLPASTGEERAMTSVRGRKNLPVSVVEPAPDDLRIVQEFVNTADCRKKTEGLASPRALADWLTSRALLRPGTKLDAAQLRQAVDLRESLRALLAANNGGTFTASAIERLNQAVAAARFQAIFDPGGSGRFVPADQSFDNALGRIVEVAIASQLAGTWPRLKACANVQCRGIFFDRSRNQSGRWCAMRRCGSQMKARTFRRRNK